MKLEIWSSNAGTGRFNGLTYGNSMQVCWWCMTQGVLEGVEGDKGLLEVQEGGSLTHNSLLKKNQLFGLSA